MNTEEMGSISLQYFQIRLQKKKSSLTKNLFKLWLET